MLWYDYFVNHTINVLINAQVATNENVNNLTRVNETPAIKSVRDIQSIIRQFI